MTAYKFAMSKSLIGYGFLSIACLIIIAWSVNSYYSVEAGAVSSVQPIIIHNRTQSLQVAKAELNGKLLHLAVKNGYSKNIDWFRISFGNRESIEADFTFAEPSSLAPGESYEDAYSVESSPTATLNVTVVSVMFEDGTSDGDATYAKTIKEKRAGQKMQLKRLLPLLQKAIHAPNSNAASVLQNLEAELAEIQEANDNTISESKRVGLRNAKERILNEVQRIKQMQVRDVSKDVRQDLIPINAHYEKILTKLEAYDF